MKVQVCQCGDCGKFRLDRAWARADFMVADFVGLCPTCFRRRRREARLKWQQDSERLLANRRRGYGADPSRVDWEQLVRGR